MFGIGNPYDDPDYDSGSLAISSSMNEDIRYELDHPIARSDYYKEHKCCPKCGNSKIVTTCVGYLDIDRNRASCNECHWMGIVHDLVPEKKDE